MKACLILTAGLLAWVPAHAKSEGGSCWIGELRKAATPLQDFINFDHFYFEFDIRGNARIDETVRMLDENDRIVRVPFSATITTERSQPQTIRKLETEIYNRFTGQMEKLTQLSPMYFDKTWFSPAVSQAKPGEPIATWIMCFVERNSGVSGRNIEDVARPD